MFSKHLSIIFVILAQLFFTIQDMIIKFISTDYALHEIVLVRASVGILFTVFVFLPLDDGFKQLFKNKI